MLSSFSSVFFACKQQRAIGSLLWEDRKSVKEWLTGKPEDDQKFPILRLSVVLLLSISKAFLDCALVTYVIGLGVYLGFVWQKNLDVDAGDFDSRNLFIVFWIYAGFCICLYYLLGYLNPYVPNQWSEYLMLKEALDEQDCKSAKGVASV